MPWIEGHDEYSGSTRRVEVDDGDGDLGRAGHIALGVEATSGSSVGVALLTPLQAMAVAGMLEAAAIRAGAVEVHDD